MNPAHKRRGLSLLAAGLMLAGAAFAPPALALGVSPLSVEVNEANTGTDSQFRVDNPDATPVPVEIEVERFTLGPNGEVMPIEGGQDDLLVLPPQSMIPAGDAQIFRVQYVGPALTESRSYFVTVKQVPVEMPEGQSGVQLVYNFRVAANVAPLEGQSIMSVVSAEAVSVGGSIRPVVTIRNAGNRHALMSNADGLTVTQRDAGGNVVFQQTYKDGGLIDLVGIGLVMPNSTRRFTLPIALPQAGGTVSVTVGAGD